MMAKIKRSSTKKGHSKNDDSSDLHSLIKTDLSKSHRHRIEKRKEKRKLKKIRRLAFNQKKPIPTQDDLDKAKQKTRSDAKKKDKIRRSNLKKRAKRKMKKSELRKETAMKKEHHLLAIKKEDRELHQLEKQLKLKKSLSTLPKAFVSDGLDFLLDAVDSEKLKIAREQNFEETMLESDDEDLTVPPLDEEEEDSEDDELDEDDISEDEVDSDLELDPETEKNTQINAQTKPAKSVLKREHKTETMVKKVKFQKKDHDSNSEESYFSEDDDDGIKDDDDSGDDEEEEDINDGDNSDNTDDGDDKKITLATDSKSGLSEDIYGRLRDQKGNVVPVSKASEAYVPPAKRKQITQDTDKRKVILDRLRKQMKGLINRTSESNIQPISLQMENIYMSNSRADVSETLTGLIVEACVADSVTPERLTMELVMLVTLLHSNVGNEVGAYFIQTLAQKFDELYRQPDYGGDKQIDNIVMLLTGLYNFKVIRSTLLFDILKRFVDSFKEKDIELILLILKSAGFTLRKDDPAALKATIIEIQTKASSVDLTKFVDQSRVKFMLDVLLAIRNNNMRKIPNFNPDHLEHLKKLTRNYIRGSGFADNQLEISLDDLLQADQKGRWWLVGSAWEGRDHDPKIADTGAQPVPGAVSKASMKLLELARKMRMNTDMRKNVFCVIMTSEDFLDAFEKLLRLGLKQKQEREIIHVIQDCCLQEKTFNPFYALLMQKFCEHDHRFQITFQFSLWDKFKEMGNLSEQNRENLAKLVSYLVINKGISLSVLKVIEFGTLSKPMVQFLKLLLREILHSPDDQVEAAFLRVATGDKLRHLQDGLKLFMQHFLVRQRQTADDPHDLELREKVKLAERAVGAGQTKLLL